MVCNIPAESPQRDRPRFWVILNKFLGRFLRDNTCSSRILLQTILPQRHPHRGNSPPSPEARQPEAVELERWKMWHCAKGKGTPRGEDVKGWMRNLYNEEASLSSVKFKKWELKLKVLEKILVKSELRAIGKNRDGELSKIRRVLM